MRRIHPATASRALRPLRSLAQNVVGCEMQPPRSKTTAHLNLAKWPCISSSQQTGIFLRAERHRCCLLWPAICFAWPDTLNVAPFQIPSQAEIEAAVGVGKHHMQATADSSCADHCCHWRRRINDFRLFHSLLPSWVTRIITSPGRTDEGCMPASALIISLDK
jgi:hypothetical protein